MKIHRIGRDTYNNGKKLLDILGQLKKIGAGRIVYRQHDQIKYPNEPCYAVISEVTPYMAVSP